MGNTQYTIGSHHVTVVKQIAEGGFSFVYLAKSATSPHHHFALKKIHCQTSEQLALAQKEISAFQRCQHAGVLRLIDSSIVKVKGGDGEEAHDVLMLFPFYSHGSLHELVTSKEEGVKRWPWSEEENLVFFLACCEALQCIHQQGYTHRDIKPHNILLATRPSSSPFPFSSRLSAELKRLSLPHPVIIDLGSLTPSPLSFSSRSAAMSHQDHAATHTTASYRSPELWQVKEGIDLDGRVDVFSLGLVFYWLSVGRSAMEEEGGATVLSAIAGKLGWEEADRRLSWKYREYVQGIVQPVYEQRWQLAEVMKRGWELLSMGQKGREEGQPDVEWANFEGEEEKKGKKSAMRSMKKKQEVNKSEEVEAPVLNLSSLAAALGGGEEERGEEEVKKKRKGKKKKPRDEAEMPDGEWTDFQGLPPSSSVSVNVPVEDADESDFGEFSSGATSPAG